MPKKKLLISDKQYHTLSKMPSETEWLDNLSIKSKGTARIYSFSINEFKEFVGIKKPEEFRLVTKKHILEWIHFLEKKRLSKPTIARKVASISSLFNYFTNANAVRDNPAIGVNRPNVTSNTGKTPAISTNEAKKLLDAPKLDTFKGKRDRAILATVMFHGLRRSELCGLKVKDIFSREGVPFLRVLGKGSKERQMPLHPAAMQKIYGYLETCEHKNNEEAPLFLPLKMYKDTEGNLKPLTTDGVYKLIMQYALIVGIDVNNFRPHSLRTTAATNALYNNADLRRVQDWLGHKNIQTTRMYDKRDERPEDSPTFKVNY